jgi:hypothetical protein
MTAISAAKRGNYVVWEYQFSDPENPGASSSAAEVRIEFPQTKAKKSFVIKPMSFTGGFWRAEWDSREASEGGVVYWRVQSTAGIIAADEGSFELEANPANRG